MTSWYEQYRKNDKRELKAYIKELLTRYTPFEVGVQIAEEEGLTLSQAYALIEQTNDLETYDDQ